MSDNGPVSRRGFLRGAAGAAVATGAAGTAAAQESGSSGSGGGGTVTVDLVDYAFQPGTSSPLTIPPGTTVKFDWKTGGHNIHVDSKPSGSDWQGHETIENAGFSVSHTFTATGDYHFWCVPHKSLGMVGDITVKKGASLPGQGSSGGGGKPAVPESAKGLGLLTAIALVGTLGLTFVFLKYGGGNRHVDSE